MKPKFRAEWEVSSEELCILASWFLSPMSKNAHHHHHKPLDQIRFMSTIMCIYKLQYITSSAIFESDTFLTIDSTWLCSISSAMVD